MENVNKIEPNLNNKPIIGKGKSAVIYDLLDGTCYKKFYNYDFCETRDQLKVLTKIRNLELHNFCKILNIVHDGDRVIGYIMTKYNDLDKSILGSNKDYLINNYDGLIEDINLLSDNSIILEDLLEHNTILTEDKIIVHDYDLYRIAGTPGSNRMINKTRFNCLINNLLYDDKHHFYDNLDSAHFTKRMYELINFRSNGETIKELLEEYNRPIDFIEANYEKAK